MRCYDLNPAHKFEYPSVKGAAWVDFNVCRKVFLVICTGWHSFSIVVYDGFHQLVLTEQFNRNCAVSSKHINDLVGVARHIKVFIGCKAGGKYLDPRQAVYSEVGHPLVFVRKANQVIVVILPFQSVRVQLIEITAMFENSFFLGRIFIILELDLSLFQDRRLDGINDVIDLLIVRFHPAGQAGELPKLLCLMCAGQTA